MEADIYGTAIPLPEDHDDDDDDIVFNVTQNGYRFQISHAIWHDYDECCDCDCLYAYVAYVNKRGFEMVDRTSDFAYVGSLVRYLRKKYGITGYWEDDLYEIMEERGY